MKIALVSTTMTIGGAEKQVVDLAAAMHRMGHAVTIVCCKGPVEQAIPDGVHLIELHGCKSATGFAKLFVRLVRVLRTLKPDVIHGHMVIANLLTRGASLFCPRAAVISTAHSTHEGGSRWRILAYRVTDALADLTTNVSHDAVEHYIEIGAAPGGKIAAVHNGIDFARFRYDADTRSATRSELGLAESTTAFLAVGRLVPAKDYPTLLRAFASMAGRLPDPVLLIAGDGPQRESLRQFVNALGLRSKVRWLGARTDIPALMNAADVFTLSSAWEGFGLVAIEAVACELPVVATDCGAMVEVLAGDGHIVPIADHEAMAKAMLALAHDHPRPSVITALARQRAQERFSIDSIAAQWIGIYGSILNRGTA